jgi:hypothetical protein
LQGHGRHAHVLQAGRDVEGDAQALLEAALLDGQVGAHGLQFGRQRHRRVLARLQRMAHQVGQLVDHVRGRLAVFVDQRAHAVEAIEEEMRIDLCLQGAQLGFARMQLQPQRLGFQLLGAAQRDDHRVQDGPHEEGAEPGKQCERQPVQVADGAEGRRTR